MRGFQLKYEWLDVDELLGESTALRFDSVIVVDKTPEEELQVAAVMLY